MDTFPCARVCESPKAQERQGGRGAVRGGSERDEPRARSSSSPCCHDQLAQRQHSTRCTTTQHLGPLAPRPQPPRPPTRLASRHLPHLAPRPRPRPAPRSASTATATACPTPTLPSRSPRRSCSSPRRASVRPAPSPPSLLLLLLLSCRRLSRAQSPMHSLTLTPSLPARSRRRLRRPHRARRAAPPLGRGAARGRAAPCARPVRARAAHHRRPRGRGRQGQDAPDRGEQGRGRRREARRAWGGELVRVGRGQGGASVLLSAAHARPRSAVRVEGVELTVVGSH